MISPRGRDLIVWMVVFNVIVLLTLVLRFAAARVQQRRLRADDYLVLAAYASLHALQGVSLWAIANNFGAHVTEITPPEASVQLKNVLSAGITWTLATVLCKLSVLWLYTQIFTSRRFQITAWVVMGVTASYAVIFIPIFFTHCTPVEASWDPNPVVQATKCRPITRQEFASVSINMALDLVIVILPLPVVWSLKMAIRRKIFVSSMFGLGLIIVAVMAWRIQTTVEAQTDLDWTYRLYITVLQSKLELWLGIIAANLPTLAPFITQYLAPTLKGYLSSWRSRHSSHKHTAGASDQHHIRTFGSGGSKAKRDKFDPLTDESMDSSIELVETRNVNRVTSSLPRRNDNPPGIAMQHDVSVSVEEGSAGWKTAPRTEW